MTSSFPRIVSLWDIMQQFDTGKLAGALERVGGWVQSLSGFEMRAPHEPKLVYSLHINDYSSLIENVSYLEQALTALGAHLSAERATFLLSVLAKREDIPAPPFAVTAIQYSDRTTVEAKFVAQELCRLTPRELSMKLTFLIPDHTSALMLDPYPFGQRVFVQFPSLADEIAEAAKCLALQRGTASAFHSIRCLEAGISAISRSLDIPDPTKGHERSWFKLLGKMEAKIKEVWPDEDARVSGAGRHFSEAHRALTAHNPYRNATMHLANSYTPEQARDVFDSVKVFIRELAEVIDENGEPKV